MCHTLYLYTYTCSQSNSDGSVVIYDLKPTHMIYDLRIVFSSFFMSAPWEMVALATSRIYLMI